MYCIISLPRTSSTNLWHLIQAPLVMQDVRYGTLQSSSIFNPRYNTPEQIQKKYQTLMQGDFLPLFKMISNHNFDLVKHVIDTGRFKTVFLKPKDIRKHVLKTIVAKQTDSFANKEARNPYQGSLIITKREIDERLSFYRKHMELEHSCTYSFFDDEVLHQPTYILETLQLSSDVKSKYRYAPPTYSDEEMLQDINEFNQLYDECMNDSTY